ncbi:MAG: hypothetical protein F4227_08410 [Gammaproteobacteria bacterium]|nr:hypothetical protein [Gammaproteobacteria bacterium]MYF02973.1 hypothetical protein [Gammaproteobacteria bacterium]MYI76720.1 hypothetical protein [Gammaproteobacteria bacterium]
MSYRGITYRLILGTKAGARQRACLIGTYRYVWKLVAIIALIGSVGALGMRVGPRLEGPSPEDAQGIQDPSEVLKPRLTIPSMRLAIPVLNPGIPKSTEKQENEGIWPELRNAEAVRIAFKMKDWITRYNQFDSIIVSADVSVSADLFLVARIVQSNSEVMSLAYQIVDARGVIWSEERTKTYRAEAGWHERYGKTDKDPFDPLYQEIAEEVYRELANKSSSHINQLKRNEFVGPRLSRRSDLELITITRDLAFAKYVSPEYHDCLKNDGNRLKIEYMPEFTSESWSRIMSVMTREEDFVRVIEKYYREFVTKIEPDYRTWQQDAFPIARKLRIEEDKREVLTEINNLGSRLHTTITPTRVDVNGKVVTLTGSVQSQFAAWRSMIIDIYEASKSSNAVKIISADP